MSDYSESEGLLLCLKFDSSCGWCHFLVIAFTVSYLHLPFGFIFKYTYIEVAYKFQTPYKHFYFIGQTEYFLQSRLPTNGWNSKCSFINWFDIQVCRHQRSLLRTGWCRTRNNWGGTKEPAVWQQWVASHTLRCPSWKLVWPKSPKTFSLHTSSYSPMIRWDHYPQDKVDKVSAAIVFSFPMWSIPNCRF